MAIGPFTPGDKLSAADMNAVAQAVAKIANLRGDKFIQVSHTAAGITLRLATTDLPAYLPRTHPGFWAKLTAEEAGVFSWTALADDAETVLDPPVTGTLNAKEVNGATGLEIDDVVWMWPANSLDPKEYRFSYGAVPEPAPAFDISVHKLYHVWGDATKTVDANNWGSRTVRGYFFAMGEPGDICPTPWLEGEPPTFHVFYCAEPAGGGEKTLATIEAPFEYTAELFIDFDDGGKLKCRVVKSGGDYFGVVITVFGTKRLLAADAENVGGSPP